MVICSNCGFEANDSKFCPQCGSEVVIEKPDSVCPSCGAEVGESKFCPECGTKIEVEVSEQLCPSCGAEVGESKFCPECGTKIEVEVSQPVCPSCGEKVGESAFCPSCGTKIGAKSQGKLCPSCGKELNDSSNFCPYCGWSEEDDSKSISDKVFEVDDVISKKLGRTFKKSKSLDKLMDKSAEIRLKHTDSEDQIKGYAEKEPVCLEVYNEIEDPFVKSIFVLEREKLGSVGGGAVGGVMSAIYIPTKDMEHDEAKQFYRDIVNNIVQEIEQEKNKGTFTQEQFYKRKVKEVQYDNISMLGGLKAIKTLRK